MQVLAHFLFPLLVLHRYSGGLSLSFGSSCFQRFVRLSSCWLPWPPRDKFYFRLNLRPSGIHGFISPACRVRTERDRGGRRGRGETRAGGAASVDPKRLVNVTKKRLGRRSSASMNEERRKPAKGAGEKKRFLEIIIPWTIATLEAIRALLFFRNCVSIRSSLFFFTLFFCLIFYDSNDRPVNEWRIDARSETTSILDKWENIVVKAAIAWSGLLFWIFYPQSSYPRFYYDVFVAIRILKQRFETLLRRLLFSYIFLWVSRLFSLISSIIYFRFSNSGRLCLSSRFQDPAFTLMRIKIEEERFSFNTHHRCYFPVI